MTASGCLVSMTLSARPVLVGSLDGRWIETFACFVGTDLLDPVSSEPTDRFEHGHDIGVAAFLAARQNAGEPSQIRKLRRDDFRDGHGLPFIGRPLVSVLATVAQTLNFVKSSGTGSARVEAQA